MSKRVKAKICRSGVNWKATLLVTTVVAFIAMTVILAVKAVTVQQALFIGVGATMAICGFVALHDRWETRRLENQLFSGQVYYLVDTETGKKLK